MQYTKLVLSVTTRYRDPTGKMGPWVPGLFVPKAFRSQELSFLQLFYKALAMNADSYSNCENLFPSIGLVVFAFQK